MSMMTLDQFHYLLDAKGADLAAWPWLKRRAAARLLARSADARAAQAAARTADALIAEALRPTPLDPALRERLKGIPLAHPRLAALPRRAAAGFRAFWYAGAATAMASVLAGFLVGATLPVDPAAADPINLAGLAYGPSAQGGLLP
jgi:hypothetical protein